MWGDAENVVGFARGGDDLFVFNANNGNDRIGDFGQADGGIWGRDFIDVSGLGILDFGGLDISAFDATTHESTITFSPGNDVLVHSQFALTQDDFIFS
jgi:hypothetical protein